MYILIYSNTFTLKYLYRKSQRSRSKDKGKLRHKSSEDVKNSDSSIENDVSF